LEKHIITLKNIEDNESFYSDMEKHGYVNEHIPERNIECDQRLEYTSNVIYIITREEAVKIKKDPRVWDVFAVSDMPEPVCPAALYTSGSKFGYTTGTFVEFYRGRTDPGVDPGVPRDQYNMALLRYGGEPSGKLWGSDSVGGGDATFDFGIISQNWTGENIDIVTLEGGAGGPALDKETGVNINHPEFLSRVTGSTRVQKLDWSLYALNEAEAAALNTPFDYSKITDTNLLTHHAAGTLSVSGGNRGGFARDANLYCAYVASPGIWNAIIKWHSNKSVNPKTGYKNPTILVIEYFYPKKYLMKVNDIAEIRYRGKIHAKPSSGWTVDELENYKICPYIPADQSGLTGNELVIAIGSQVAAGAFSDTIASELSYVKNAVDAGIHVFSPLGNQGYPMAYIGQADFDNWIGPKTGAKIYLTGTIGEVGVTSAVSEYSAFGTNTLFYNMQPVGPSGSEYGINVAALFPSIENHLESYTSKGPCTHICSPGSGQFSARPGKSFVPGDSTNEYGYFSGTSAATPFAAGIGACYLEYDVVSKNLAPGPASSKPLLNPAELRTLLIERAETTPLEDPSTPAINPSDPSGIARKIISRKYKQDIGNNTYMPSTTLYPFYLNGSRINFRTMGTPDVIIRFPREDRLKTIPAATREPGVKPKTSPTEGQKNVSDRLKRSVDAYNVLRIDGATATFPGEPVEARYADLPEIESVAFLKPGEELRTAPVGFGGRNNGGNAKRTRQEITSGVFALAQAGGGGSGWKGGGGGNLGGGGGGGSGFANNVSGTEVRSGKADNGGNSGHGFIRLFLNETGPGERPKTGDIDPIGPSG